MSWCERKLEDLREKGKDNWDEDDWETFFYCKGTLGSEESERAYLNGED